jgi:hypothetical protein
MLAAPNGYSSTRQTSGRAVFPCLQESGLAEPGYLSRSQSMLQHLSKTTNRFKTALRGVLGNSIGKQHGPHLKIVGAFEFAVKW